MSNELQILSEYQKELGCTGHFDSIEEIFVHCENLRCFMCNHISHHNMTKTDQLKISDFLQQVKKLQDNNLLLLSVQNITAATQI